MADEMGADPCVTPEQIMGASQQSAGGQQKQSEKKAATCETGEVLSEKTLFHAKTAVRPR